MGRERKEGEFLIITSVESYLLRLGGIEEFLKTSVYLGLLMLLLI